MPSRRSTGRSWTTKTLCSLFEMTADGYTQAEIAKNLRRTPKAIERKVAKVRRTLATEFRRKTYLTMTFPTLVRTIMAKPTDVQRLSGLIAGDRI